MNEKYIARIYATVDFDLLFDSNNKPRKGMKNYDKEALENLNNKDDFDYYLSLTLSNAPYYGYRVKYDWDLQEIIIIWNNGSGKDMRDIDSADEYEDENYHELYVLGRRYSDLDYEQAEKDFEKLGLEYVTYDSW